MACQNLFQSLGMDRHALCAKQERLESAKESRVPTDGHRSKCVAVIPRLEADEQLALRLTPMAPILVGHLQSDFDGRAAVVGVEDAAAFPGDRVKKQFGTPDRGLVSDPSEH